AEPLEGLAPHAREMRVGADAREVRAVQREDAAQVHGAAAEPERERVRGHLPGRKEDRAGDRLEGRAALGGREVHAVEEDAPREEGTLEVAGQARLESDAPRDLRVRELDLEEAGVEGPVRGDVERARRREADGARERDGALRARRRLALGGNGAASA